MLGGLLYGKCTEDDLRKCWGGGLLYGKCTEDDLHKCGVGYYMGNVQRMTCISVGMDNVQRMTCISMGWGIME